MEARIQLFFIFKNEKGLAEHKQRQQQLKGEQ